MDRELLYVVITALVGLAGAVIGGLMSRHASLQSTREAFEFERAAARLDRLTTEVMSLMDIASAQQVDVMRGAWDSHSFRSFALKLQVVGTFAESEAPELAEDLDAYAHLVVEWSDSGLGKDVLEWVFFVLGGHLVAWLRNPESYATERPRVESLQQIVERVSAES